MGPLSAGSEFAFVSLSWIPIKFISKSFIVVAPSSTGKWPYFPEFVAKAFPIELDVYFRDVLCLLCYLQTLFAEHQQGQECSLQGMYLFCIPIYLSMSCIVVASSTSKWPFFSRMCYFAYPTELHMYFRHVMFFFGSFKSFLWTIRKGKTVLWKEYNFLCITIDLMSMSFVVVASSTGEWPYFSRMCCIAFCSELDM